jgi:hypothetical protein
MEIRATDLLEASAKGLALGAVLLPLAGAGLRLIAFATGTPLSASPYQLAWSAPVVQLAATGLSGLFPSFMLIVLMVLLLFTVRRIPVHRFSPGTEASLEAFRMKWRKPGLAADALLLLVLLFFLFSWPTGIIGLISSGAIAFLIAGLVDHPEPWRLRHWWPLIVLVLANGAITSGLSGDLGGIQVGDYRFKPDASNIATDGRYAVLGESGDALYLFDCNHHGKVVGVAKTEVIGFRFQTPKERSATSQAPYDLIFRHRSVEVGFRPPC